MCAKQISIMFCGGCNPQIDRGKIAAELHKLLSSKGYIVSYNFLDSDFIVYLSGCSCNCAQRYNPAPISCAVIAGAAIDNEKVDEKNLVREITDKVRDKLE